MLDLYSLLDRNIFDTKMPIWLEEWICQYLSFSAEERDQKSLSTKASFALQKRKWTCLHLDIAIHEEWSVENKAWQFVLWAVDFLEKNIEDKNLYYTLHQKWKRFVASTNFATSQTRPVDYFLKTAFL